MKIPEDIKKCVAFIGLRLYNGEFNMAGTVFFITRDDNSSNLQYAVTAKHVIEGIKSKGLEEVYIRLNLTSGKAEWFKTQLKDWKFHKDNNVDIATHFMGFRTDFDHLVFPISGIMTEEVIRDNEIDVGDEVFVTGLFRHHHGVNKNIPIVRVGNISAIPDEKIQTKHHLMDGFLIEARSIGGLSGSPVFVNLGITRLLKGEIKYSATGIRYHLMGLIYGHYDSKTTNVDELIEDKESGSIESINTGIAIVTPITKLIEHLDNIK